MGYSELRLECSRDLLPTGLGFGPRRGLRQTTPSDAESQGVCSASLERVSARCHGTLGSSFPHSLAPCPNRRGVSRLGLRVQSGHPTSTLRSLRSSGKALACATGRTFNRRKHKLASVAGLAFVGDHLRGRLIPTVKARHLTNTDALIERAESDRVPSTYSGGRNDAARPIRWQLGQGPIPSASDTICQAPQAQETRAGQRGGERH